VSDRFTLDVDTTALLAAIEALPDVVLAYLKPAAKITADNICREAKARLQRQLGPEATGATVRGIHVEETRGKELDGYVVLGYDADTPHARGPVDQWLEFGTQSMTAREFLFASARLEEGAHDRRARAAVQDAIDAQGLGDTSQAAA
jgi:hypothetical protein